MINPAFTDTTQIGIVVRDLAATVRRYEEEYGIGPWEFAEASPSIAKDVVQEGEPLDRPTWRVATAMVGRIQWELIEPLDDKSLYARFLAEKGEGVHHLAVVAANYDASIDAEARRGRPLALTGNFAGARVSYLPTASDLGVLLEIARPPDR